MNVSRETDLISHQTDLLGARLNVSRETQQRLVIFQTLLRHWNRRINLVSRHDEPFLWPRHVADALQLIPLIPSGLTCAIDLGSGAGFPGLILAIATGVTFTLIEADSRKAAFLREAARETGAPVIVQLGRIESAILPTAGLVTARALARLSSLLELALPFLTTDGVCLFPKGRGVEEELTEAMSAWRMVIERHPSQIDPSGVILRLSEVARAHP